MRLWYYRSVIYGDRKHWELRIRRFNVYRWCQSAPCHLPGYERSRHWVGIQYLSRKRSILDHKT